MNQVRLRILLVDDDEDDYVLTHAVLNECYGDRVEVEWVSSYEPAKEALLSGRHELCLLDYHLEARTGLELLRETMSRGCTTPIILLTGNDDWNTDVEAMEAGAADYLVKGQFGTCLLERSIRYARGFAAERQHTLQALRSSEERYALAVRGANDGLWDWDLSTNRIYFAPRWKSMLGYAEGQIGDSPDEWFGRVHRLDVERVKAEVDAHLAGRSTHLETECRILHDDGTYRWFLTRGLAVRDNQGRAVRIAGSQSDITQRKVVEDRLQHNAFHDSLTGLPNRALLLDRLGQAVARTKRRPDCHFGVLFLDLDGFKFVNDSLGHQMGDQLLIAIARRLERCLRDGDTVARLGGDEFIILMEDVTETRDVLGLADRVLECLQTPFSLDGHELVVTASIGIALGETKVDSAEEVVRNADIAMYRAKSRGKSSYVVFDDAMHAEAVTRLQLNTDLRQATARGELHLYYQPIVALRTGRISGFEALLRWYHPDRGLVCPDDFVPLAEETKLILPIGMWVIRTAAEQLRIWQKQHRLSDPLSISVNMSCRQFSQPDLVYQIERVLLETGLDARCLRMEITESAIMEHVETASSVLTKLKALGVKLALDDFGKGYSSLSYLHQFPFDTLKLDRSFIARIGPRGENLEIVRTIVSLAQVLGLDVVAEGVETARQLAQLQDLGCQLGQGYFFSRPLTAQAASAMLEQPPGPLEPATCSTRASTRHLAQDVQPTAEGRVVDAV
jgi:diguanylate cyclase (GGDEF)-like protein/PAS domain S-box-containing protein